MAYLFTGYGTICGVSFPKKIRKVDEDDAAAEVDITGGGDTEKVYESGLKDLTLAVDVLGGDALAVGTSGATNITWGDGTTTTWPQSTVVKRKKSGSVGAAIVYSITVRKTAT